MNIPYIIEQTSIHRRKPWLLHNKYYDELFWFVYYHYYKLEHYTWDSIITKMKLNQLNEMNYKYDIITKCKKKKLTKAQFEELKSVLVCERHIQLQHFKWLLYCLELEYIIKFVRGRFWSWNDKEEYNEQPSLYWAELLQNEDGYFQTVIYKGDCPNTCIYVKNLNKPLKSIGSYTLHHLRHIAETLNLPNYYKMKKKELYEFILLYIE